MDRKLIVTHHAPDLDAIGGVWMLKRFDAQHYASAKLAFVNPGDAITLEQAEEYGCQLHEVTHVDTGLGEFDHHQPERGDQMVSATSLTYDYVCQVHPELKEDKALKIIADFVTEIDHFREIHWPEADSLRYTFMIHELIRGLEHLELHDDDSQLHFGLTCLDSAYSTLTNQIKAFDIIESEGEVFEMPFGKCLGVETSNDDVIKGGQKKGFALVIRKDPKLGNVRIKVRPDADIDLKSVADKISQVDTKGTWYYHPSGKMLINGSRKHRNQVASPLPLSQVIAIVKEVYGQK